MKKKNRIIGSALIIAMLASFASIGVNAAGEKNSDFKDASFGITGSFCSWSDEGKIKDVPMTDEDGDGVYEGTFHVDKLTGDMISESMTDDGKTSRGFSGVQFKVRTDNSWTHSWGDFEVDYDRTYNSQTNCCVEAKAGESITVKVKLDTNSVWDQSAFAEEDQYTTEDDDFFNVWPVTYERVNEDPQTSDNGETNTPSDSDKENEGTSDDQTSNENTDVKIRGLLPGCKIQILDEDQKVIFEGITDENGEVLFKLLPGIYYYRESQAPAGYELDDTPYQFEIKNGDEIIDVSITNDNKDEDGTSEDGDAADGENEDSDNSGEEDETSDKESSDESSQTNGGGTVVDGATGGTPRGSTGGTIGGTSGGYNSGYTSDGKGVPQTGDTEAAVAFAGIALVSAGAIAVSARKKSNENS